MDIIYKENLEAIDKIKHPKIYCVVDVIKMNIQKSLLKVSFLPEQEIYVGSFEGTYVVGCRDEVFDWVMDIVSEMKNRTYPFFKDFVNEELHRKYDPKTITEEIDYDDWVPETI